MTPSLPSLLGRNGVAEVLTPPLAAAEARALAEMLRTAPGSMVKPIPQPPS